MTVLDPSIEEYSSVILSCLKKSIVDPEPQIRERGLYLDIVL